MIKSHKQRFTFKHELTRPIGFLLAISCCNGAAAPKGPMTNGTTADGFGGQLGGWGLAG